MALVSVVRAVDPAPEGNLNPGLSTNEFENLITLDREAIQMAAL